MRAAFFVEGRITQGSRACGVYPLINWWISAESGSMITWLTDIRKTALVALIAAVFGAAYPLGIAIRTDRSALANFSRTFFRMRDIPFYFFPLFALALVLMIFALAVTFGFPVALYRSKAALLIPIRLRRLALLAAVASTLDWLWHLFPWIRFYWTQFPKRYVLASVSVFTFEQLSEVAYILFLVAIFRHRNDSGVLDARDGRNLRRFAKSAVVFWSIVLAGIVVGAVTFEFEYPHFQNLARQSGRAIPSLQSELAERARYFLQFALLWVPPFIVYRSLRANREVAEITAESI
jgi:hypothetical protein